MECFQVRYDSRVVIYECKLFIRLATVLCILKSLNVARQIKDLWDCLLCTYNLSSMLEIGCKFFRFNA